MEQDNILQKFKIVNPPEIEGVFTWLTNLDNTQTEAINNSINTLVDSISDVITNVPGLYNTIKSSADELLNNRETLLTEVNKKFIPKVKNVASKIDRYVRADTESDYYDDIYDYYTGKYEDNAIYIKGKKKESIKEDTLESTLENTTSVSNNIELDGVIYKRAHINYVQTSNLLDLAHIEIDEQLFKTNLFADVQDVVYDNSDDISTLNAEKLTSIITDAILKLNKNKTLLPTILSKYKFIDSNILSVIVSNSTLYAQSTYRDNQKIATGDKCTLCNNTSSTTNTIQDYLAATSIKFIQEEGKNLKKDLYALYTCPYCGNQSIITYKQDKDDAVLIIDSDIIYDTYNRLVEEYAEVDISDYYCIEYTTEDIMEDSITLDLFDSTYKYMSDLISQQMGPLILEDINLTNIINDIISALISSIYTYNTI